MKSTAVDGKLDRILRRATYLQKNNKGARRKFGEEE